MSSLPSTDLQICPSLPSFLEGREDKFVSTETLLSLAELVLKNNFFEHNNVVYKQNQGTAIGKKFAPSYAILFVGDFEERALENYCSDGQPIFIIQHNDS